MSKQVWPAPERNKGPILEVLKRVFPERGTVLEVASGTGQHGVFFAKHLPGLRWIPTDIDPVNLASIEAHIAESGLGNLVLPLRLDVLAGEWPVGGVVGVFCANMIHIAPFSCTIGLLAGVGRVLVPGGVFALYGPFMVDGQHTSPSNEAFDTDLKRRNPEWGVRDASEVIRLAKECRLWHVETIEMPANNKILLFAQE